MTTGYQAQCSTLGTSMNIIWSPSSNDLQSRVLHGSTTYSVCAEYSEGPSGVETHGQLGRERPVGGISRWKESKEPRYEVCAERYQQLSGVGR